MRLVVAKAGISPLFEPGHAGREAVLALPDEMSEQDFDVVFPMILRLLRLRSEA